ncbi:sensor histidine kinase [Dokdonia sinensis]|uniref:sensor histidine kinase n=1 Tax=Dokdonia sinensis TaxID=2479847 RepID=UPI0011C3CE10|nr:histidine kinase [Dokdonia sinensis]
MLSRLQISIAFLGLVIGLNSVAQEPVQIHFTEKEGLPDKEFYNVAEDSKGFMWFAGNKGLTRYDGTSFITLEHPEKRGLSVFELEVDHKDRVWCVNISGQLFYTDGKKLELYADLKDELKGSLAELTVSTKFITLHANSVLIIFNRKTGKKQTINTLDHSISLPEIIGDDLYLLYDLDVVKITDYGLEKAFDVGLNLETTPTYRPGTLRLTRMEDDSVLLYAVNEQLDITLYSISKKGFQKTYVPEQLKNKQIVAIKRVGNSYWWLTNKGAFFVDIDGTSVILKSHILSENYITDVASDKENNLWFTTLRDGVYVLPNLAIEKIGISEDRGLITRMAAGAGNDLILGFSSGDVVIYDTSTSEQTIVNLPGDRRISSLLYNEEEDAYWYFQDILSYTAPSNEPNNFKSLPFQQVSVKSIITLGDNYYAYVNSGNVVVTKDQFFNNKNNKEYSDLFIGKRGYKVIQTRDKDNIYIATVDELLILDKAFDPSVIKNEEGQDILGQSFAQTDDGHIWVVTFTNGLYEIEGAEVISHYNEDNGLLSNRTTVVATQGNDVWIGTDKGLQVLERSSAQEVFKSLTKQDGILSYDIKDIVIKGTSAHIATGNGLFKMDTEKAFKTFEPSELYLTDVIINTVEQPLKDFYEMHQGASDFTIRFNANGFRGLSNGFFKYRLSGYSKSWTTLRQGDNEVQFASLPKGDYTFQIAPVNDSRNPDNLISVSLVVSVPFYKEIWFYGVLGSAFMIGTILYYRRLLGRKEAQRTKENERLQLANQLTALKLENLQSQMNPHFIFNALNSIQDYIVHNEKDLASSYLVKFSRLIRMYLEQSRKNSITLDDELQAMRLYLQLEKVRFEDKLDYDIIVGDDVVLSQCLVPPLFIQPYIENAIKHGLLHRKDNRKLKVHFKYDVIHKFLEVVIEDNGIGRVATQAIKDAHPGFHKSFATQANDSRVTLLNKNRLSKIEVLIIDLYDDNKIASGTKVTLKIPNRTDVKDQA